MQKSGRNNACPVCGRKKDGDCRWSSDIVFCHLGATHGPDQSLNLGDTITIDGAKWALVKTNGGFDGAAFVFRPHQERNQTTDFGVNREQLLTKQAKRSIAVVSLERFFTAFNRAWDLSDFHEMTPQQLQLAIDTIGSAHTIAIELSQTVQGIWREHPDLSELHKERFDACLTTTKAMVAEMAHFRSFYLGESPVEAWG